MFEERTYRNLVKTEDLTPFRVTIRETDLFLLANRRLEREAKEAVIRYRWQIEEYMRYHPEFRESLTPIGSDPHAPKIVKEMLKASRLSTVGPMASVAGAIAEFVGKDLIPLSPEVISPRRSSAKTGGTSLSPPLRKGLLGSLLENPH
jgi:ApbE superfamily uncharacterized protein (UPF0280 family)